jgi:hypothetical protein
VTSQPPRNDVRAAFDVPTGPSKVFRLIHDGDVFPHALTPDFPFNFTGGYAHGESRYTGVR